MTEPHSSLRRLTEQFLDEELNATVDPASIRVLVVDDDATFADRLAAFLEERYEMSTAVETSGEAALDRLRPPAVAASGSPRDTDGGHRDTGPEADSARTGGFDGRDTPGAGRDGIDCVVCDYEMPGMDGIELVEAIREKRPALPIVVFAGQGSEAVAGEVCRRGADDYLQKDTDAGQFDLLANRIQATVALYSRSLALRTFYQAVEHAGHSICITDPDGTIRYVNPAFEEITGYAAEEAIGHDPSLLKSGVHDDTFYADLWETILAGEVWENELVNERKDGEQYYVEQTIAPITNDQEDIVYFVAINNDITELKRRTNELERQNDRLEEFARTLSHDLRNPLNVAQGRLILAERTGDEEHFGRCRRALERMETMLDDAMTLARQGLTVRDPEPIDVCDVADSAWENVVTEEATLTCDTRAGMTVIADRSRACELLENLFNNAIEHAGPSVSVHVGEIDEHPGFYVADDGPGIPADERETVFEAGYTTKEDGTGFGLSIVREIAAAHDWGIEVRESDAGGARFEFAVPASDWNVDARD